MKEKANGSFSLLLSWVLIGRPHPVTKVYLLSLVFLLLFSFSPSLYYLIHCLQVQIASPLKPGYTSHFSLVKLKRASESLCESSVDFKSVDGLLSYFPISGQEEVEGDEIIIFKSAQVLPRFIVHYSVVSFFHSTFIVLVSLPSLIFVSPFYNFWVFFSDLPAR